MTILGARYINIVITSHGAYLKRSKYLLPVHLRDQSNLPITFTESAFLDRYCRFIPLG